ncbi:hypothetical protein ACIQU6_33950 [Streptomyces sp. NPDC090442]|uniref:hypothetical protein n=1 Tax=Streptomyces sp. NPDC090442 TaxID=3365962 RepID=UPI0038294DD8
MHLPCPYPDRDLDPGPVTGCNQCADWAQKRNEARDQGRLADAVRASMIIRQHIKWGSHD